MFTTSLKSLSGGRFDPKLYSQQTKDLINSLNKTKFNYQSLKSIIIQSCSGDWGEDDKVKFDEHEFVRCLVIRATEFDNKFNLNVDGSRAKFRVYEGIVFPDFIFNYLKTIHNIKITDVMQSQTNGIRNLILNEYLNLPIPIPPLDKQKEIADNITAIRQQAQKLKDKTKEALKKASQEIETILLT
jgi:hypothetical protein